MHCFTQTLDILFSQPDVAEIEWFSTVRDVLPYTQLSQVTCLFQRLATRMEKGIRHLPYIKRLQRLNLCSHEKRRLWADLILAYGIFHGRFDHQHDIFFTLPSCSRPEVASSFFSLDSSKSCYFCANRRAMVQVTTFCHLFAFDEEPTRCLLGDRLQFECTSITVYNSFTWFSAICA